MAYKFGWIPDVPDARDLKYRLRAPVPVADESDLRETKFMPPIQNQGKVGSCTGHATAGIFWYVHRLMKLREKDFPPSRLFIYNLARVLEQTPLRFDSGAALRDCIKVVAENGVCDEQWFKYTAANVVKKPTTYAKQTAKKHKALEYTRIEALSEMLQCLSEGYPFMFGMAVYDSFLSDAVSETGVVPMPAPGERVRGGHAIWACGHSRQKQQIICANSWGPEWGDRGYFYLPFDYVSNPDLCTDFWTIRVES